MDPRPAIWVLGGLALTACGGKTGLDPDALHFDEVGGETSSTPTKTIGGASSTPTQATGGASSTPTQTTALGCGTSGICVSTTRKFSGDLGGLDGADQLCQVEYPGSHFYRESCDSGRNRKGAFGYAELEIGPCWDCDGWTSGTSGNHLAAGVDCPIGYATVGAVISTTPTFICTDPNGIGHCWRICEAGDKPLMCCTP